MSLQVKTEHPVAIDSPDHKWPKGTRYDNHTDPIFIEEVEKYFNNQKINFVDLGCAGGQLALDFMGRGHTALGLEGSDYSAINKREGWARYYEKYLFTCDLTKPYTITKDDKPLLFDCITSWEVLEHIKEEDLPQFMQNIVNHLKPEGIFCASVTSYPDFFGLMVPPYTPELDKPLHQTVQPFEWWRQNIFAPYIELIEPYPFTSHVRADVNPPYSAWFASRKKQ